MWRLCLALFKRAAVKSRVLLPASVAIASVIALSLILCQKEEDGPSLSRKSASRVIAAPPAAVEKVAGSQRSGDELPPDQTGSEPEKRNAAGLTEEEQRIGMMGVKLHHWLVTWADKHGGQFPPDSSVLVNMEGFPAEQAADWLGRIIEYRGRDLNHQDSSKLLLLRYRINDTTDREVRVCIGGSTRIVPATEPIPEDAVPPPAK